MVGVSFLGYKSFRDFISKINNTDADYIHVDVKDNHFVKNKFDPFLKLYLAKTFKELDVHLMCQKPLKYIKKYALLNTKYITVHVEIPLVSKALELIKSYGIKTGLAIKPSSDLALIIPYLDKIDYILLMSVEPGLSGQSFKEEAYERLKVLKEMTKDRNIVISIDGGVNNINSNKLRKLGADILVSSSYITSGDFQERIDNLR